MFCGAVIVGKLRIVKVKDKKNKDLSTPHFLSADHHHRRYDQTDHPPQSELCVQVESIRSAFTLTWCDITLQREGRMLGTRRFVLTKEWAAWRHNAVPTEQRALASLVFSSITASSAAANRVSFYQSKPTWSLWRIITSCIVSWIRHLRGGRQVVMILSSTVPAFEGTCTSQASTPSLQILIQSSDHQSESHVFKRKVMF